MMTIDDLEFFCCPFCHKDLTFSEKQILCSQCQSAFPIVNGIPRFLKPGEPYNASWDFKWTVLDGGRGLNYQLIDPALKMFNVFKPFEEETDLFKGVKSAVDVGCGTGQYSVCLLQKGVSRVLAIDLTRGVDVGADIVRRKYPQFADRILFIQGDARRLPFKTGIADLGMALASIHHSGSLEKCLEEVIRVTKRQHSFFVWIYARPYLPVGDKFRNLKGLIKGAIFFFHYAYVDLIHMVLSRLPDPIRLAVLNIFASDILYWFQSKRPTERIIKHLFPGINDHPEKAFRLINLYDAYSPTFSEHSDESDVIRWSRQMGFEILKFTDWRLGFVGRKPLSSPVTSPLTVTGLKRS